MLVWSVEEVDVTFFDCGLEDTRIGTGHEVHLVPRLFEVSAAPVVKGGEAPRGATANYVRRKAEECAPRELSN